MISDQITWFILGITFAVLLATWMIDIRCARTQRAILATLDDALKAARRG